MIRKLVTHALRRLRRALATWPDASGWRFSGLAGAATLAGMAIVGFAGGLYRLQPPELSGLPLRLVSVIFVPALGEEAVFRGLFVPNRAEAARPWAAIVVTTAIFTGWHVAETLYLPGAAATFLRPDFLACAAILGVGCAVARWRTGSLWPAVMLHWLAVVVWQTWLGGPGLETLQRPG